MARPSKHSKELAGALAEDHKRQAIDAAKKRAVAQQADYDTFKKLVSVAHLKPLQAPSSSSTAGCLLPAWKLDPNCLPGAKTAAAAAPPGPSSSQSQQAVVLLHAHKSSSSNSSSSRCDSSASAEQCAAGPSHVPRNSQEFIREWRRSCPTTQAKYRLLKLCGAQALAIIFRVEITGELLGQLLLVLQEQWVQPACCDDQQQVQPSPAARKREAQFVVQLLHSLTGAGRFDLNARLIGSKAKQAAAQLLGDLAAALAQPADTTTAPQPNSNSSGRGGSCMATPLHGAAATAGAAEAQIGCSSDAGRGANGLVQPISRMHLGSGCPGTSGGSSAQRAEALQQLEYVRHKLCIPA